MRIRKHAQRSQTFCLPSQLPSPDNRCPRESPPTRVCQLNRSPWDVMSFTSEANDSGGETSGAVESIPSLSGTWEDDYKLERKDILCSSSSPPMVVSISGRERREVMNSMAKKQGSFRCCNKTDGKGWKCKKEAKRGHSLCEHHLAQLKSYYTNNKSSPSSCFSGRGLKSDGAHVYRGKRSSSKTKTPSSSFYYYTGFGPLWGKGRVKSKKRNMVVDSAPSSSTPSLSSHDDVDDEDTAGEDSVDDGNVGKKKKSRKPVKTRSLKSLL